METWMDYVDEEDDGKNIMESWMKVLNMGDKEVLEMGVGQNAKKFQGKSLMLLKTTSVFRSKCIWMIVHPYFDYTVLFAIFVNAVFIALDDDSDWSQVVDIVFLVLFSAEATLKVIAMGFLIGQHTYLRDPWNVVDFVIVVCGWISYLFSNIAAFSVVRIVRVFRPLRSINRIAGMRRLVNTLFACLPLMLDVVLLSILIFYLFSIAGVVLWHESLHNRCQPFSELDNADWLPVPMDRVCGNSSIISAFQVGCFEGQCVNSSAPYKYANFDHIGKALLLVFQCVTLDGWVYHSYAVEDGWSPFAAIFFVFLTMFGAYFFANLILAVVTDALAKYTSDESNKEQPLTAEALTMHESGVTPPKPVSIVKPSIFDKSVVRGTQVQAQQGWAHFVNEINEQAAKGLANIQKKTKLRKRASTFRGLQSLMDTKIVLHKNGRRPRSYSHIVSTASRYIPSYYHSRSTVRLSAVNALLTSENALGWQSVSRELNQRFAKRAAYQGAIISSLVVVMKSVVSRRRRSTLQSLQAIPFGRETSKLSGGGSAHGGSHQNKSFGSHVPRSSFPARKKGPPSATSTVISYPTTESLSVPGTTGIRHQLRILCRSSLFNNTIIGIILLNALLMSLEHYDMPSGLESILEKANMGITFVFVIETALKITALGKKWPRDRFNLFDFFVAAISLFEFIFLESKAVSLFRVFRLCRVLRVLKLARSWKVLHNIIKMIGNSLSYIGYLVLLILLFIFIFAVLGRAVFEAINENTVQWCNTADTEDLCTSHVEVSLGKVCEWRRSENCELPVLDTSVSLTLLANETDLCGDYECRVGSDWQKMDPTYRARFDKLHWAAVHVFQVLTRDNWALLCFRAMDEVNGSAVLYFLTILIFGTYLLFSMFVAILLVRLSEQSEARKLRKQKKQEDILSDGPSEVQSPLITIDMCSEPNVGSPTTVGSPTGAIAGSPNAISRSDVLLYQMARSKERRDRIDRRKRLKFGERSYSVAGSVCSAQFDEHRSRAGTFKEFQRKLGARSVYDDDDRSSCMSWGDQTARGKDLVSAMKGTRVRGPTPSEKPVHAVVKQPDAIERILANADECYAEDEEDSETDDFDALQGHSFGIFSPESKIRLFLTDLILQRYFEMTMGYLIILNCCVIALNKNILDNSDDAMRTVEIVDWVFTGIFTLEIVIKCVVYGVWKGEYSYLRRQRWNKVDTAIVLLSLISIPIQVQAKASAAGHHKTVNTAARAIKAFRAFRPLRILVRTKRMKVVIGAFVNTIPAVFNVMAVAFVLYFIFGIAGVQLMKGAFRRCSDGSDRSKNECVGNWQATASDGVWMTAEDLLNGSKTIERKWENPRSISFDNLLSSWTALLEVAALSGWMDIMYAAIDSNEEIDDRPIRENRPFLVLYFISWIFAGAFFVMNIFTGVVVDHFSRQKVQLDGSIWLTNQQEQSLRVKRILLNSRAKKRRALPMRPHTINKVCYGIVTQKWFPKFILTCVVINVLLMATVHRGMDGTYAQVQSYGNMVFTVIFTVEMILEMCVAGPEAYFNFKWFRLDCAIVVISWIEIVVELIFSGGNAAATVQLLRLARCFRLLRHFKGLRKLLMTLYFSIPAFYNIASLLFLMFFIFAILGMALFEDVVTANTEPLYPLLLSDKANFRDFPRSMLTLYRVATMDTWVNVWSGCQVEPPYCSYDEGNCGNGIIASFYFSAFMIIIGFVMMNLFIAIILENFRESVLLPEDLTRKMQQVSLFRETWARYDPKGQQYVKVNEFIPLLKELNPPIGLKGKDKVHILRLMKHLDFPITWPDQNVLFADAVDAIGEAIFNIHLLDSLATRKYLKTENRMELYKFGFTIAQWCAACIIQSAWREYTLGQAVTGVIIFTAPEQEVLLKSIATAVKRQRLESPPVRARAKSAIPFKPVGSTEPFSPIGSRLFSDKTDMSSDDYEHVNLASTAKVIPTNRRPSQFASFRPLGSFGLAHPPQGSNPLRPKPLIRDNRLPAAIVAKKPMLPKLNLDVRRGSAVSNSSIDSPVLSCYGSFKVLWETDILAKVLGKVVVVLAATSCAKGCNDRIERKNASVYSSLSNLRLSSGINSNRRVSQVSGLGTPLGVPFVTSPLAKSPVFPGGTPLMGSFSSRVNTPALHSLPNGTMHTMGTNSSFGATSYPHVTSPLFDTTPLFQSPIPNSDFSSAFSPTTTPLMGNLNSRAKSALPHGGRADSQDLFKNARMLAQTRLTAPAVNPTITGIGIQPLSPPKRKRTSAPDVLL
eukprot:TRINITY_DN1601_c4_g1_i1.p1 TRINITY_DN1601_c4_g1~~TRINITY_DN1601_c4_g1_i1.p1  ORF type:complete len:2245 (+),score=298.91 TRINITY_DN1601_c4_g1_i1:109-6843(+)